MKYSLERYKTRMYYLLLMPAVVLTLVLLLVPLVRGVQISFTNLNMLKGTDSFVGIKNYIKVFTDVRFYEALYRTLIYTALVVLFNFFIGFGMAYICCQKFVGNKILRTIIIMPMLLIPSAGSLLWMYLYNYDLGAFNKILNLLGIGKVQWLISQDLVLYSIAITDIWSWTPFMFLLLLAGLEGIDKTPIEAAKIDGASEFQLMRYVIIPMMGPVISVSVALKAINVFRTFDYVWIMTKGGPGTSSEILSTYIYKESFKNMTYGYSSAMSIAVMLVSIALSILLIRKLVLRRD